MGFGQVALLGVTFVEKGPAGACRRWAVGWAGYQSAQSNADWLASRGTSLGVSGVWDLSSADPALHLDWNAPGYSDSGTSKSGCASTCGPDEEDSVRCRSEGCYARQRRFSSHGEPTSSVCTFAFQGVVV